MKKIVKKAQAGTSLGQKIHRSDIGSKPVGRATKKEDRFKDLGGEIGRPPFSPSKKKAGGKMKGGMAAFEKTAFDKNADKPGGRHGAEGSAKDKKMDKIDAKKMGFIKGKKK